MSSFLAPLWWLNAHLLYLHATLRSIDPAVFCVNLCVNLVVSCFRLVFPLCTAYVFYSLILSFNPLHLPSLLHLLLLLYSSAELFFFFYLQHRCRTLQRRRAPPPLSKEYRAVFIRRVLVAICKVAGEDERSSLVGDDRMIERARGQPLLPPITSPTPLLPPSSCSSSSPQSPAFPPHSPLVPPRLSLSRGTFDLRRILQGWFYNAPVDDIWERNLIQWLCHGLFHRDWSEMSGEQREDMMELWTFLKAGGRSQEELDRARAEEENRLFLPSRPTIDRTASVVVLPHVGEGGEGAVASAHAPPLVRSFSDPSAEPTAGLPMPSRVVIHPGFNKRTKCMRVIIDPIQYQHRPLFLYALVAGVHWLYSLYLRSQGYTFYSSSPSLQYFHRPPPDPSAPLKPALVFVHGISNGLSSYYSFVEQLSNAGNRHVLLVVLPFISMRIHEHVPTAKDTVDALKAALTRHTALTHTHKEGGGGGGGGEEGGGGGVSDFPRFILVGHSYGTLVASWFVKAYPHLLLSTVMIDPVCFLLFLPHLCYNFLYRQPISPMHHILSFFAAKELFISHTLHRHFFWTVNVLWVEDLTHIGEDEDINPARQAEREHRQKAENWKEESTSTHPVSLAPTTSHLNDTNGHHSSPPDPSPASSSSSPSSSSTSSTKRRRPFRALAATPFTPLSRSRPPEPELVLNAAISPLLRAPRVIERLPPVTRRAAPPSKCYVFLSEKDDLIYAPAVYSYLVGGRRELMEAQVEGRWRGRGRAGDEKEKGEVVARLSELLVHITMWKSFRHAQFLTSAKRQSQVLEAIEAAEGLLHL